MNQIARLFGLAEEESAVVSPFRRTELAARAS
jgi:hypothetical protein